MKYTKKVWFNRNRFLQNKTDAFFSIPLQNDSD
ncbi:WbqC family protein [Caballeronia sordidicola]